MHVPFHSLNHEDDEELPQSILDKADHDLVGKILLCYVCRQIKAIIIYMDAWASCAQISAIVSTFNRSMFWCMLAGEEHAQCVEL